MNEDHLPAIGRTLLARRAELMSLNKSSQRDTIYNLDNAVERMRMQVNEYADRLKSYIGDLQELPSDDLFMSLLDAIDNSVGEIKRNMTSLRAAHESTKQNMREINMDRFNITMTTLTDMNEYMHILYHAEMILFAYPPSQD